MVKQLYTSAASRIKAMRVKELIIFALISGAVLKMASLWKQIKSRQIDVDLTYRSDITVCWTVDRKQPEGSGKRFLEVGGTSETASQNKVSLLISCTSGAN